MKRKISMLEIDSNFAAREVRVIMNYSNPTKIYDEAQLKKRDKSLCNERIMRKHEDGYSTGGFCSRKAVLEDFCSQHNPGLIKKRKKHV